MEIVARPLSPCSPNDDADGAHGLTWRRIFKIRNTVCWRWFYKFGMRIPFEEFASEANQVIVESLTAFAPCGAASFAHFLYRALSRRMPSVARREWAGTIEYSY